MIKRMILKCVTGLALLSAAAHCYAERAPNEYVSWKDCKVGTMIKVEATDSSHPGQAKYFTAKLVKIEGDVLSIEEAYDEPGEKTAIHRVSPPEKPSATQPAASKAPTTQPIEESDQQIEIAGHKVKAHVTKDSSYGEVKTIVTSDEVPGGFCSITIASNDGSSQRIRKFAVVEITRP